MLPCLVSCGETALRNSDNFSGEECVWGYVWAQRLIWFNLLNTWFHLDLSCFSAENKSDDGSGNFEALKYSFGGSDNNTVVQAILTDDEDLSNNYTFFRVNEKISVDQYVAFSLFNSSQTTTAMAVNNLQTVTLLSDQTTTPNDVADIIEKLDKKYRAYNQNGATIKNRHNYILQSEIPFTGLKYSSNRSSNPLNQDGIQNKFSGTMIAIVVLCLVLLLLLILIKCLISKGPQRHIYNQGKAKESPSNICSEIEENANENNKRLDDNGKPA